MMNIIKPGIVLLIITSIAGASLGAIYTVTKEPIELVNAELENEAKSIVLSDAKQFDKKEIVNYENNITGAKVLEYSAGKDEQGNIIGYAIKAEANGYGGAVQVMVGISAETGNIEGIDIVSHSETPGLGANATNDEFKDQYVGKGGTLTVSKTNSSDTEILAITSATITSTAVTNAVNCASEYYTVELTSKGGIN